MKFKLFFLFFVFLLFLFPSNLLAGKIVTAKGISFFEPGRELIARDKAIDEAKRAALEQAIGATVESSTTVENFTVIKDQIMSRTAGYLKNIKIIEEKKTDMATIEVIIEADVETSAILEKHLKEFCASHKEFIPIQQAYTHKKLHLNGIQFRAGF
ncbi:MAG: hypothetical protein KKE00_09580, partial [Proteobacteria bacterium]|nr:hypothetical protein [Pseudomonadota bacterium]